MSDQSAIQPDVPNAEAPAATPATPPRSPRDIMLEELETRHQQQMAEQNGYQLEADPDADADPAAAAPQPAPAPQEDQLAAQMAAETPNNAPSTVRVKVDGVETEVPFDEVVRQYQKNSSADRRLAEATRLLREAQETATQRLLEAQQAPQAAQPAQPAAAPAQPESAPAPNMEAGKEFLRALFEGDEENALAKLQELTMSGRQVAPQVQQPIIDIDQISNAVTQHVQQKLQVESALAKHRADYPALYSDPDLEALALAKVERLRQETGSDFFSALNDVSAQMADKFGWNRDVEPGRPQATETPTTNTRQAKLERKAGIDNVTSVSTKTSTSEPAPESPSDIIAQMRAARGG